MDVGLVSVIMPAYNCQEYIEESIRSVLAQTYSKWELIITDDCSDDGTGEIVRGFAGDDSRIRYFRNEARSGAAVTRNRSIEKAQGRYLAFLDADDIWKPEKLEVQLKFMDSCNAIASCSSYGKINEQSVVLKKECTARKTYSYHDVLRSCPGNSTMIYDCEKIGKIEGPVIEKRNDFAMFLQVIKKAELIYGIPEVLGYHRVRSNSLSSNKLQLVRFQWKVYHDIEKLGFLRSLYFIVYKMCQTAINKNG